MNRTYRFFALLPFLLLTLRASVPRSALNNLREVRIDVSVSDKHGNPVLGLEGGNFRVFAHGVEQSVTSPGMNRKPMAVVILLEYSNTADYDVSDVIEPVGSGPLSAFGRLDRSFPLTLPIPQSPAIPPPRRYGLCVRAGLWPAIAGRVHGSLPSS
jgi:hypothetical protein